LSNPLYPVLDAQGLSLIWFVVVRSERHHGCTYTRVTGYFPRVTNLDGPLLFQDWRFGGWQPAGGLTLGFSLVLGVLRFGFFIGFLWTFHFGHEVCSSRALGTFSLGSDFRETPGRIN
jgi:hypothetical protein